MSDWTSKILGVGLGNLGLRVSVMVGLIRAHILLSTGVLELTICCSVILIPSSFDARIRDILGRGTPSETLAVGFGVGVNPRIFQLCN